jgi:hypothetical protein
MHRHITVIDYAAFKLVTGALGKPAGVFWWRENPNRVNIFALLADDIVVRTNFEVPPHAPVNPVAGPETEVAVSPLSPAGAMPAAAAPVPTGDVPPTPAVPAKAGKPADKPKTILETDFPGAIEVPGGLVFS